MPRPIALVFDGWPDDARPALTRARALIFEQAGIAEVGPLTETLKWGQPAYLTDESKAGSTVRLGMHGGQPAVFFNCNTTLVEGFRADFPEAFDFDGKRALLLDDASDPAALAICLARALTYHRDKRKRAVTA